MARTGSRTTTPDGTPPRPKVRAGLRLGAARRDITPAVGTPLIGYPSARVSTGVDAPLHAKALVFGTPGAKRPSAAIVVIDGIFVHPPLVRAVRRKAVRALPGLAADRILLAATHTHSGPALRPFPGRGEANPATPDPAYVRHVEDACVDAMADAWNRAFEAEARVGLAESWLGSNRRVVDAEGRATNEWRDPKGRHPGFFDPRIRFVVFHDATDGRPRALLYGYGCHPVVLGPGNTRISPDYPGHCCRELEREAGLDLAVHVTRGGANINPRDALHDDPARARAAGKALAGTLLDHLELTRPLRPLPIAGARTDACFPLRPAAATRAGTRLRTVRGTRCRAGEVQVLRLGDLALVGTPGELFAELAAAIENRSPLPHALPIGCAGDACGYLFTDTAGREGGYESAGQSVSEVERPLLGAVDRLFARVAPSRKPAARAARRGGPRKRTTP